MESRYGKVAIIMRTKDRILFLKRAIKSVVNQSFTEWILVIVNDGGNKDEIENLLREYANYKEKIVLITNKTSLGMESASNKGIKFVDSKYIVIHDDDDTWEKDFLLTTVSYLEKNETCMGVITHSNKVIEKVEKDTIKIKKIKPFNTCLSGMIDICELCVKNLYSPISFVYKRSVFEVINGLYNESLPVLGDWEFNLRFIRKYDIHIIEERLANYHQRPQIKEGKYSNSIIGQRSDHLYYENLLRNKFLREDFDNGKFGIGILLNLLKGYNKNNSINVIRNILKNN